MIPLCRRKDNDPLQLNSLGGVVVGVVVEIAFGEGVDVPGDGGRPFQHELVVRPSVHVAAKTAHLACVGVTQGYLHNVHQHEWDGLPVFYVHRDRTDFQREGAQDSKLFCLLLMLLYVYRDPKVYLEREAQDGHLDFHTVPEL